MKTTQTTRRIALIALLGAALAAPVLAQGAPGGPRGMRFDRTNTPGWTLMTGEERTAYQDKIRAVKSYDECKAIQVEQHSLMETRAKEKGVTLQGPQDNACDVMKARGYIK